MNQRAKFDAASSILGKEIQSHTNTHTHIHTDKQTVNEICTPCLSECVDNKLFDLVTLIT